MFIGALLLPDKCSYMCVNNLRSRGRVCIMDCVTDRMTYNIYACDASNVNLGASYHLYFFIFKYIMNPSYTDGINFEVV